MLLTLLFSLNTLACAPAPPPVVDLDANKFYKDASSSIIDPVLKAKHDAAVKPLEDYIKHISSDEPKCAIEWLTAWAHGVALLGKMMNEQSFYERKWMLAGFALVYARARTGASPEIDTWLSKLADLTIEHSAQYKGGRNNHYYWEGLAVGATGLLVKNQRQIDWAKNVYNVAMTDIANDGSLPREIARGQRALHYHCFAAAPLAFLDSLLDMNSPRMKLLVDFTVRNLKDPAQITKMAGVTQEPEHDADQAWLLVYNRRHPSKDLEQFLATKHGLKYPKLGGDLSVRNPLEHLLGKRP